MPEVPPYAVLDIDGVLADVRHRLHFLERRPKNWGGFFGAAGDDPLLPEGRAVAAELAVAHEVVYLTGRPESLRAVTERWLLHHRLPRGRLLMRPPHDRRPARLTKPQALRRLTDGGRTVAVVVDDDVAVCAALRAEGWPVFHADWMLGPPAQGTLFAAQELEGRT